jgi:hypothetical protein
VRAPWDNPAVSENSTRRPIAGHAIVMALIAWSLLAAISGAIRGDDLLVRLLCLGWVALGAWLLVQRWRSHP